MPNSRFTQVPEMINAFIGLFEHGSELGVKFSTRPSAPGGSVIGPQRVGCPAQLPTGLGRSLPEKLETSTQLVALFYLLFHFSTFQLFHFVKQRLRGGFGAIGALQWLQAAGAQPFDAKGPAFLAQTQVFQRIADDRLML